MTRFPSPNIANLQALDPSGLILTDPVEHSEESACQDDRDTESPQAKPNTQVESERVAVGASNPEEAEVKIWVERAKAQDHEAFENLVSHFQDKVWRRAMYRLRDHDEAYDLTQEVFLVCYRKIHQFRGESKFWTWLGRIIDNLAINRGSWLRRRGKGRTYSLDAGPSTDPDGPKGWDPPDPGADPRRRAEASQAVEHLNENLEALSPEHREILLLRFAEDLSYEEIADSLRISAGTVKSRISRARAELRSLMAEFLDNP